jgi:CBS domain-containing protein
MHNTDSSVMSKPSASLILQLCKELSQHPPFAQMQAVHVQSYVQQSQQHYYAPGENVLTPTDGPVLSLHYVRSGSISGSKNDATLSSAFSYEAGDMFAVNAALTQRPVSAIYKANADSFVLTLPSAAMQALAQKSDVFADFLNHRIQHYLSLSRKALQEEYASRVLDEQSLETPLGNLIRHKPMTCSAATPLRIALQTMEDERIGSILVTHLDGSVHGILTRYDVLGRVTLAGVSLDQSISTVMVTPVHTLTRTHTAQDAALLMSRLGIRHIPVTQDGIAVGIVSERDLFAMQRLSLQQLSSGLRRASSMDQLNHFAREIRLFAKRLLGQGVHARQLTSLISHLNDLLTQRLLDLLALKHHLSPHQACWIALGSEGRDEQTIATDQDNALILQDDCDDATRDRWIALALEANTRLDTYGFPLCKGNIMASNPQLCLTVSQWKERFSDWIEHGAPKDLLNASIFFDLRGLWGQIPLAQSLHQSFIGHAPKVPRFLMQLATNALTRTVPLTWTGAIETNEAGMVDLKLRGTAIFVDAARLYTLAHGLQQTNTRARFEAVGNKLGLKQSEYEGWISAFEFLQTLRFSIQIDGTYDPHFPNSIDIHSLNTIDRRILKEAFTVAHALQQRMRLDYLR